MDETTSVRASFDWLGEIVTGWVRWVREHLLITIVLSAAAFAVGWVWNTYVMAVHLQGSVPGGQRTVATAQGEPSNALFWLLLFSLLTGLATYGWQRGWLQMVQDFGVLPRRFAQALRDDVESSIALLLWGLGVALLTATVISSAVSLVLGLVLVTLAATPLGVIVNFAVIRLWRGLTGVASPESGKDTTAFTGPFLLMVGEAFGLFVDWGVDSWLVSLVVGIFAGGLSLLLGRRGHQGVVAGMYLVGATVVLGLAHSHRAWADDGGWDECITDSGEFCRDAGFGGLFAWFGSDGASTVMAYASIGGISSGIGTAIGFGVGAAAAVGVASSAASGASGVAATTAGSGPADLHGAAESDRSMAGVNEDAAPLDSDADSDSDSDSERSQGAGVGQPGESPPESSSAITSGDAPASSASVSDFLPEPPEREDDEDQAEEPGKHGLPDADAADGLPEPQDRSTPADPSPTGQGAPGADINDVLPEPPDREDEESEDK